VLQLQAPSETAFDYYGHAVFKFTLSITLDKKLDNLVKYGPLRKDIRIEDRGNTVPTH
jgi:hypothetical protein